MRLLHRGRKLQNWKMEDNNEEVENAAEDSEDLKTQDLVNVCIHGSSAAMLWKKCHDRQTGRNSTAS